MLDALDGHLRLRPAVLLTHSPCVSGDPTQSVSELTRAALRVTTLLGVSDATLRSVLNAWGPGKFDAEIILDSGRCALTAKPVQP